jgi:hypothetical protein
MRPGAGYLPTLALGRPRGLSIGARHMTLLRRRPRQVYRVYTEDEFLGMGEWLDEADRDLAPAGLDEPGPAQADRGERRVGLRQVVGIAVPAAVVVTVSAIVAHDLRSGPVRSRHRGSEVPADRSLADSPPPRPVRKPAVLREGSGRAVRPGSRAQGARRPLRRHVERRSVHEATPRAISAARAPVAATVAARQAHPEFGFER